MRKYLIILTLLAVALITCSLAQSALAKESRTAGMLIGRWEITLRSVNAAGKPCPFIPEAIDFNKDQTVIMANAPGQKFQFKTDLTADEKKAMEARNAAFKDAAILLVRPNPALDWRSTPMVYIYSVSKDQLSLTVQGWGPAKFKRVK